MPKCDFNRVAFQSHSQIATAIEIALRHGCSPVNLLHIFRTPFQQSISEWLLLCKSCEIFQNSYSIEYMKAGPFGLRYLL